MIIWTVLMAATDRRFWVEGTELARALLEPRSRFAVYEVRRVGDRGEAELTYYIRDRETSGNRPLIVFRSNDLQECLDFVEREQVT